MARFKGTFVAPSNYEVQMQAAFDPRVLVEKKSDLINKETWPYSGDTIYIYKGILVSVQEENAIYMLTDLSKALSSDYSGWLRVDAGNAEQVEVVDNLESDASDKALSAKQGKVLMSEITTVKGKLTSIYSYKGSVEEYEDLPEDASVGDVYNVQGAYPDDADGEYPAGTNWAWTGESWDALAGSIDLSSYYTKDEVAGVVEGQINSLKSEYNQRFTAVEQTANGAKELATNAGSTASSALSQAQQNYNNISSLYAILNGNSDPNDEIEDTIGLVTRLENVETLIGTPSDDDKTSTMLSRLNALENLVTGGEGGEGEGDQTLLQKVNANTLDITSLETTVYGADGKSGLVKAVEILNSDDTVEGSVDYKIKEAFKWIEVQ